MCDVYGNKCSERDWLPIREMARQNAQRVMALPEPDDEELSAEDKAAIEAALAEPTLGPFTMKQLEEMVQLRGMYEAIQAVPSYCERFVEQEGVV